MAQPVVIPSNLGLSIKPNAVTVGKYDVNVDGVSVKISPTGQLFVDVTALPAGLISADLGNDLVNGTDGKLFVDVPIKGVQVDGVTIAPNALGIVNLTDNDVNGITDSSTIDLTLVGTQLTAVVKVSASAGNALVANADGLFVPTPATFVETPFTVIDSATVNLITSGVNGHELEAVVNIASSAGNLLSGVATGLQVTPSAVRSLLDVEVQDAFGVTLFFASSTNV